MSGGRFFYSNLVRTRKTKHIGHLFFCAPAPPARHRYLPPPRIFCDSSAYGKTSQTGNAHATQFSRPIMTAMHARYLLPLALAAVFLLASHARAQNATASPLPQFSPIPAWAQGHVQPNPYNNVVTETMPKEALKPLLDITTFFKEFADEVQNNKDEEEKGSLTGDVEKRTCNMQSSDWAGRANTYLEIRGLPKVDTECATEREVKPSKNYTTSLKDALPKWARWLNKSSPQIAKKAGQNWGQKAAGVARFWYPDRENQNCTLWHTMGVRSGGNWYVQARVTADSSSTDNTAGSDNNYIIEHIRAASKTSYGAPLLMKRLPTNDDASNFSASTTAFETWSRPAPDSVGVNADISRNVAFRAALSEGDNWHQQAQDAEQVSNTAILLLPLAMNLVPVALIADVNTFGMLLYTALTDVLTTVPLCIKGVELINISKLYFTATSAQITGDLEKVQEMAVAEAWVAKCRLKEHESHFRRGVIFVALSLTLMLFGVACEFVARWYVKEKKKTSENLPIAGQYGSAAGGAYGTSSGYQPFTAAAITLQNRVPSRNANMGMRSAATTGAAHLAPVVSGSHGIEPGHIPGTHGHVHGTNCPCACHSAHYGGSGPEYGARAHPDPLARKYH